MAILQSIAIKPVQKGLMVLVPYRDVGIQEGLLGDCKGAGGPTRKRQITVLSQEQWDGACEELGKPLPWQTRRANLLVKGLVFGPEHVGKHLRIGPYVVLEVTGETDPCQRMDQAYEGLKNALTPDWRGGVTCRVLHEGAVAISHKVELI